MDRVVMAMMDDGLGQEHGHTHTHLFISQSLQSSQYRTLAKYYLGTYYIIHIGDSRPMNDDSMTR